MADQSHVGRRYEATGQVVDALERITVGSRQVSDTAREISTAAAGNAHPARQGRDGAWQVDGIELSEPGNWIVTVDVALDQTKRLTLTAPIVIEPGQ